MWFHVELGVQVDALVREVGILREGVITFHEFVAATLPRTVYLEVSVDLFIRRPAPHSRLIACPFRVPVCARACAVVRTPTLLPCSVAWTLTATGV